MAGQRGQDKMKDCFQRLSGQKGWFRSLPGLDGAFQASQTIFSTLCMLIQECIFIGVNVLFRI